MNHFIQNKTYLTIVFVYKYYKSILAFSLILFLSFSSPSHFKKLPDLSFFPHFDKFVHYVLYVLLTIMLLWETKNDKNINIYPKFIFTICLLFPVLLGGLIEIMQQSFFAPRTAEWIDWFADIAGVLTAWIIMKFFQKFKPFSL